MSYMALDSLPDPLEKFRLGEELGTGFCAKVYKAEDLQENRTVAIKIQKYDEEHREIIEEEYRILRDHSSYPNLPDFYGVYRRKRNDGPDEIWFVLQYCGDTAENFVNRLIKAGKVLKEEHIAFILQQTAKACIELHRNHFIHRDIRGSNILITKDGEVKLCDFGLTREVDSTFGKRGTCIGSPSWMAPEVVTAQEMRFNEVYGSRCDVWSLGITAIELADGRPPFADMHPTRAMFQIVRNPPPTLFKPSNWTQDFCDFIAECLEKNPENRPYMLEIIEHPFLSENSSNEFVLQQELKHFIELANAQRYQRPDEVAVDGAYLKKYDSSPERMYVEDLAAINSVTEHVVLDHLENRLKRGQTFSFIGDIFLSLNSNDLQKEFPADFHAKYQYKSRSENSPHIFTVADSAYQDMMHHKEPQHVVFAGESYSGKSTNVKLFLDHLFFLGGGNKGATERVEKGMKAIKALINAGTPVNNDSTRAVMHYHITFGSTGKLSGAIYIMYMLEKMRVSTTDMNQHNFHIFYYFYDYMIKNGLADEYNLDSGRKYRYLRIPTEPQTSKLNYPRDHPDDNAQRYEEFETILNEMDVSKKCLESVRRILSAILNLGQIRFKQGENRFAEIEENDVVTRVADLLKVDWKKFQWALINYCKLKGGIAERKQYTTEAARDARDALAATIYNRLVDWAINRINQNLAFPRAVFGDTNEIILYDMFGFECFHRNGIEQLMVNTMNEQMQYHYNQKIFASEMFEMESDGIPLVNMNYFDNKQTLDHLLTKPEGLFVLIDDATRNHQDHEAILERIIEKRSQFVKKHSAHEISIAHYTGKIIYDLRAFVDTNRDFVPAEMIESLRTSLDENIHIMFTNDLNKTGNLTMEFESASDRRKQFNLNTLSKGQYSQLNQMRTISTLFRATCLEQLKCLSTLKDNAGTHFVRCVRADLEYKPRNFHPDMVQQQIKALAVIDTIVARQQGFSCRITFQEFLRRYQFLAFDFDETVDITRDNCRLLLLRLKMEGWAIGKSKVFLRYYNDEFLARLYETQVKKIIKVQSMMRSFLARRRVGEKNAAKASGRMVKQTSMKLEQLTNEEAALKIQKVYRGFKTRQKFGPLINERTGIIDQETATFVKSYAKRWKAKSLFHVILLYRAARFQDLVNMSQQVHLYNQRVVAGLQATAKPVFMDDINPKQTNAAVFGPLPLPIRKIPFRLDEIPFFDTTYMCDVTSPLALYPQVNATEETEDWDAPLQKQPSLTNHLLTYNAYKKEQCCQTDWQNMYESDVVTNQTFSRDPHKAGGNRDSRFMDYASRKMIPSSAGSSRAPSCDLLEPNYYPRDRFAVYSSKKDMSHAAYGSRPPSCDLSEADFFAEDRFQNGDHFDDRSMGSHRGSLHKKRMAPTPPPMNMYTRPGSRTPSSAPMRPVSSAMQSTDTSWMNRAGGNKDRPVNSSVNPVRELEMIGKRGSREGNEEDDPPFNFKAMLRKTNYSRPQDNNNYDYRSSEVINAKPSSRTNLKNLRGDNMRRSRDENENSQDSDRRMRDSKSSSNIGNSTYIEEEIAPGVTLKGYAINI